MEKIFLFLGIVFTSAGSAQSIESQSISSAAMSFGSNSPSLAFTVGEIIVKSDSGDIVSGFSGVTNSIITTLITESTVHKCSVKVFPNPGQDILVVELINSTVPVFAELYDLSGKCVFRKSMAENVLFINLENLAADIYLLQLKNVQSEIISVHKVQKL
jgi:hypothetical protein